MFRKCYKKFTVLKNVTLNCRVNPKLNSDDAHGSLLAKTCFHSGQRDTVTEKFFSTAIDIKQFKLLKKVIVMVQYCAFQVS